MGIVPNTNVRIDKGDEASSSGDRSPALERGMTAPLDEHRIRQRAYVIWIEEGQPEGRELEHWLRARGELERQAA